MQYYRSSLGNVVPQYSQNYIYIYIYNLAIVFVVDILIWGNEQGFCIFFSLISVKRQKNIWSLFPFNKNTIWLAKLELAGDFYNGFNMFLYLQEFSFVVSFSQESIPLSFIYYRINLCKYI